MAILLKQVFVGLPKTIGRNEAVNPMEREWTSAIFKDPVEGPIWVGKTGLTGDGQGDLEHHGGPEKAVFAYPLENYFYWQKELGNSEISAGGMGENLVLEHITEETIAIGDTFQIGEAVIQVSQPRQPCWKPARRFKVKNLALLLQNTGKTGWYFRVLQEGLVEAGQSCTLLNRPYPQWTIQKVNQVIHGRQQNFPEMAALSECHLLAPGMRDTLVKRIEKQDSGAPDIRSRVYGPNE
ncbi:MOSC domain-containing protein [Neobacillus sp. MM2021_6]|uniref:MOSC domain-containing protein n=1 Tax=Bacillaceae TaxID=186817 RepID=UPI00140BAE48|nr:MULTISPECIES: MOSC domain-containing protein [Bacillaceae]MBO0962669.1 MOSC domain-containing protein [Neobacillus sp. MM2021_6]NHC21443.1 MOSC domain-containing protein [Bacillus sp. MM2020_4]